MDCEAKIRIIVDKDRVNVIVVADSVDCLKLPIPSGVADYYIIDIGKWYVI